MESEDKFSAMEKKSGGIISIYIYKEDKEKIENFINIFNIGFSYLLRMAYRKYKEKFMKEKHEKEKLPENRHLVMTRINVPNGVSSEIRKIVEEKNVSMSYLFRWLMSRIIEEIENFKKE